MLSKKTFQTKIEEAAKIFITTEERLKIIQSEISTQKLSNISEVERLTQENKELDAMFDKTSRQREAIQKLID